MARTALSLLVVGSLGATVSAQPKPGPPKPSYPVGAIAIPCTLRTEIEAKVVGSTIELRYRLSNLANTARTIEITDRCPGGAVTLEGLSEGRYDPTHSCNKGRCAKPSTPKTITIGAHASTPVGATTLAVKGDTCNDAWPMGSTFLQARVTPVASASDVCAGAQVHVVRDHATGTVRLAKLDEPAVPRHPPTKVEPKPAEKKPATPPPPVRTKPCPTCGFACTNGGVPTSRKDKDGCTICGCDQPGF